MQDIYAVLNFKMHNSFKYHTQRVSMQFIPCINPAEPLPSQMSPQPPRVDMCGITGHNIIQQPTARHEDEANLKMH